jgi:hypothetical protein
MMPLTAESRAGWGVRVGVTESESKKIEESMCALQL